MKIPGNTIATKLQEQLTQRVKKLQQHGITPTLATILIGNAEDQISYVSKKRAIAERIGAQFKFIQLPESTTPPELKTLLRTLTQDSQVTGIIVQQPLPPSFEGINIYDYLPPEKEIEAQISNTLFIPPIARAVATIMMYSNNPDIEMLTFFTSADIEKLKKIIDKKNIVIVGRGITGGAPIIRSFSHWNIPYTIIHSQTINSVELLNTADIVITAVGKPVVDVSNLKKGVMLINAGLRKEGGKLKGDYDDTTAENTASFYTPTPGGLGPVDVTYLFVNLIEAAEREQSS